MRSTRFAITAGCSAWLVVCAAAVACNGAEMASADLSPPADAPVADASAPDAEDGAPASDASSPLAVGPPQTMAFDCLAPEKPRPVPQDLGHQATIQAVVQVGDRIVSSDAAGWILWDATAGVQLAGAVAGRLVAAEGSVFLVERAVGQPLEIRSLTDGRVRGTIPAGFTSYGLAADGSYAWSATAAKLVFWSPEGVELRAVDGSYAGAGIFAASDAVRLVQAGVVTTVPRDGAPATSSPPFGGSFVAWLADGSAFVVRESPTKLRVRDTSGSPMGDLDVPAGGVNEVVGGREGHVWRTVDGAADGATLDLWKIGTADPVAHLDVPRGRRVLSSRGHVMIGTASEVADIKSLDPLAAPGGVSLFRLGVTLTHEEHAFPFLPSAFAVAPGGEWSVAWRGVVSRRDVDVELGCGIIRTMHGVGDALAVVTYTGRAMVADIPSGKLAFDLRNTSVVTATVGTPGDAIALQRREAEDDRVVSVRSGDELAALRRPVMSGNGTRVLHQIPDIGVGVTVLATSTLELTVPVDTANFPASGVISHDGRAVLVTERTPSESAPYSDYSVRHFADGKDLGSLAGASHDTWLDDDTFVVNVYQPAAMASKPTYYQTGKALYGRHGAFKVTWPRQDGRILRHDRLLAGTALLDFDGGSVPLPFAAQPAPVGSRLVGIEGRTLRHVTWQ